jgi:hypothetical protein
MPGGDNDYVSAGSPPSLKRPAGSVALVLVIIAAVAAWAVDVGVAVPATLAAYDRLLVRALIATAVVLGAAGA